MPSIDDFDLSGASESGGSVDDFDLSSAKSVDDFDLSGAQEASARDIRPRAAARLATLKAGGDDFAHPGEGSPQTLGPRSLSELAARRKRAIPAGETNLPKTTGPYGDVGAVVGSVLGGSTEFAGAKPEGMDVVSIAKSADNPYVSGAAHWFEQPTTNFGPWAKEKFKDKGWLGELAGAGGGAVDAMTSPEMVTLFGAGPVAGLASKTKPVSRLDLALQKTVSAPGLIPHDMGAAILGQGLVSIPGEAARYAMGAATGDKAEREEALAGLVPNVALAGMALHHAAAGPREAAAPRAAETPPAPGVAAPVEAPAPEPQPSVRTRLVRDGNGGWVVQPDSPAETVRVAMQRGPGGQVIPVSAETGMPLDPRHTPPALPELPDFTAPLPQTLGPRDIPAGRPGLDFPANAPPKVAANQAPRPGSGRMNVERDLWDEFQRQQAEAEATATLETTATLPRSPITDRGPYGFSEVGPGPSQPLPAADYYLPTEAPPPGPPRPSRRETRAAAMAAMVPEGLDTTYPAPARTPADIVLEAVGKTPPPAGGPVKSNAARAAEMAAEQQPPAIPGTNEWAREKIGAWSRKAKKNINVFEQPPWGAAGEEPAPPPPAADVLGVQTEPVTPEMAAAVNRQPAAGGPPPQPLVEPPGPRTADQGAAPGDIVRRWRQERGEPVTGENIPPDPADVVLRRFMQEREQQRPPTTDPRARAIMERLRRPTMAPPPEGPVGPFRRETMTPEEAWQETQRANLEKDRAQATPTDPSAKFLDAIPQDQAELLRDKRRILQQLDDPANAERRGELKDILAEINNRLYPDAEAQLEEIRSRPRTYRPLPDRFAGLDDSLVAEAKRRESAGDETVDDSAAYSEAKARREEALTRKRDKRLKNLQAEAEAEARAELEGDNPVRRHVAEMESAGKSPEEIDALLKAAAESGEDFAPHAQWLLREREQRAAGAAAEANAPPPPPEFDDVPIGDLGARDFTRSGASDPDYQEYQEYQRLLAENERLRAEAAAPPGGPRDRLVQEARSAGLGTPEQVEAVAQVWDARAKQWAKETGRSVGQFFQKFFGSVRKGGAPADALRQGEAPVFYSKLRRVVEGMKAPMTPDQLRGYLKAQGVKPEELEWTNLDSALEGRRLVRPQELLQHIDANQVKVKEILKGGGGAELSSAREALRTAADERERLFDEAHRIAEVRRQLDRGATARATEQLIASGMSKLDAMHAVDDFRYAMLDGVPYNGITASPEVAKAEAAYAQAVEDHHAATRRWREAKEKAEVLSGNLYKLQGSVPKFGEYQIPGGEGYRELLLQMDLPGAKKIAYTSTTPVEVRQEPGPGKWYMVQRDGEWRGTDASSGEEGFPSREAAESAMRAEQASRTVTGPGYQSPHWKEPDVLAHARFSSRDGGKTFHIEEIQSDIHQQARKRGYRAGPEPPGGWDDEVDPLPNAPFKKTWPELVFKRLLRYAAENGYERVTWTPGDVQAERYDLSKKINELYWEPQHAEGGSGRPSGRLQAWNQDGEQVMNSIVAEDKLPDHIGKELADRVIQKSNRRPEAGPLDVAMSGLDLKVGGEGMKGFYDKIIPSIADKLGKRFGAKVGEGTIEDGVRVHSLEITPAMRDSVMEGQPLFQGAKGAVSFMEDGKAVIHALSEPDVSTFLHESAHVFRRTLTDADRAIAERVYGVKDGAWERSHEERWATDFENYAMTGRAPTKGLAAIFEKFKQWLTDIYRSAKGVEIHPEIRDLFDRILGGEEERDAVQSPRGPATGGQPPAEPLSPRDQAVVDAAKKRKPTMTTGMGLGALGENPGEVISNAAKTVLNAAKKGKSWLFDPMDPEGHAAALEQARQTVLDDIRDRGVQALWDDPRNLMKTGELEKQRGLTEAERALDEHYVSGQRKSKEKTTNQKLLGVYQDAVGFNEPARALEETTGDTRPESARASGILSLPGHRGVYEDMARHDLRNALEPIKDMPAAIDKLDRYLGSKKLLEKYNDLQRQHSESEAARAKVSAYEADDSNPKPTAREESLAARETSAPSFEDIAREGYTMDEAQRVVAEADPRVVQAAENLGEIGRRQMQRMVDSGAISQETADKLNALYSTNAPLYRDIGGDGPAATGSRPLKSGTPVKRFKGGSDRKFNSPFYNWLDHQAAIERTIYLNNAKKAMLEPLIDNPEMRKAAEESGMVTFEEPSAAVDARFEERAARIKDLAKKLNIELNPEELELFSEMNDSAAGRQLPLHNQVLETRIGGKIVRARVSEDLAKMYEALSSTLGHQDNVAKMIGNFMAGSAKLAHGAITSLPEFALRQIIPDQATSMIYGEKSRAPRRVGWFEALDVARGKLADAAKIEKLGYDPAAELRAYTQTGAGMTNFYGPKGQQALVREAMTPQGKGPLYFTSFSDFLSRGGDLLRAMEQVPTMRDYLQRRLAGDAAQDSAYNAVKTTRPNFAMYGSSSMVRALRSWTPFMGAGINGADFAFRRLGGAELLKNMATTDTPLEALKKTAGKDRAEILRRQRRVLAGGMAIAGLTSAAFMKAYAENDEDVLGEMRSAIGRDHLIFRPWKGADKIRIRLPETIGQIFNMYPWMDGLKGGSDDYAQRWVTGILTKAYTNITPPVIQAAAAIKYNRASYDSKRQLIQPSQEKLFGHLQANRNDSSLARGLGTDTMPAPYIDEALGIFGLRPWIEQPPVRALGDAIARARGYDMGESPAWSWSDVSPLRGFLHHTSRDTYSQGRFYENLEDLKKRQGSYDSIRNGETPLNFDRRIKEMAELEPDKTALQQMLDDADRIAEKRKLQTKTLISTVYDGETKRALMDEYQDQMNEIARAANQREMIRRALRREMR